MPVVPSAPFAAPVGRAGPPEAGKAPKSAHRRSRTPLPLPRQNPCSHTRRRPAHPPAGLRRPPLQPHTPPTPPRCGIQGAVAPGQPGARRAWQEWGGTPAAAAARPPPVRVSLAPAALQSRAPADPPPPPTRPPTRPPAHPPARPPARSSARPPVRPSVRLRTCLPAPRVRPPAHQRLPSPLARRFCLAVLPQTPRHTTSIPAPTPGHPPRPPSTRPPGRPPALPTAPATPASPAVGPSCVVWPCALPSPPLPPRPSLSVQSPPLSCFPLPPAASPCMSTFVSARRTRRQAAVLAPRGHLAATVAAAARQADPVCGRGAGSGGRGGGLGGSCGAVASGQPVCRCGGGACG